MEKFKTLNNQLCKDILRHAIAGKTRIVYMCLYNSRDLLTDELFVRLHNLLLDVAPLTHNVYKTFPNIVKSFYNQLWLCK